MKKQAWSLNVNNLKIEPLFFLLVTVLNLFPVAFSAFFPTMDGAAHLYNSNLINDLLFNPTSTLHRFFLFTPELLPNWTGHTILCFFNFFFPAFVAEKVLVLFYLIGLPYAFRNLLKVIYPENIVLSYFIFPFTYSFFFFLGFYNFSIALVFFFAGLAYWIKWEPSGLSLSGKILLFFILLFTYFSHIFVFALLIVFVLFHILFTTYYNDLESTNHISSFFKKIITFFSVSILPILLMCIYFIRRPFTENHQFLSPQELIQNIVDLRPIIALNYEIEGYFAKIILYVLVALSAFLFIKRAVDILKQYRKDQKLTLRSLIQMSDYWFFLMLILLVLYFKLPDSDGAAGYVSTRIALMLFLVLILWIAAQKISKWLIYLAIPIVLYCNFKLNEYYQGEVKTLNAIAQDCSLMSEYIEPNSIVLPVMNYNNHWLAPHFSNYLGIDKPMVILDNYEASTGYFPLKWNDEQILNITLGDLSLKETPCISTRFNEANQQRMVDYVFVLGKLDSTEDICLQKINQAILSNYALVNRNPHAELYKRKI